MVDPICPFFFFLLFGLPPGSTLYPARTEFRFKPELVKPSMAGPPAVNGNSILGHPRVRSIVVQAVYQIVCLFALFRFVSPLSPYLDSPERCLDIILD